MTRYLAGIGERKRSNDGKFMRFGRSIRSLPEPEADNSSRAEEFASTTRSTNDVDDLSEEPWTKTPPHRAPPLTASDDDNNDSAGAKDAGRTPGEETAASAEKRFMRFGRDGVATQQLSQKEAAKTDGAKSRQAKYARRRLRFGRSLIPEASGSDETRRFAKRPSVEGTPIETKKRFMRFGKRDGDNDDDDDDGSSREDDSSMSAREVTDDEPNGRSTDEDASTNDVDKRFMRFGKRDDIVTEKRYMRFGKRGIPLEGLQNTEEMPPTDKRFMRFGKRPASDGGEGKSAVDKRFMRFGKRNPAARPPADKRFMRFGKRQPAPTGDQPVNKRFMRFGKRSDPGSRERDDIRSTDKKRFMRFGKRQGSSIESIATGGIETPPEDVSEYPAERKRVVQSEYQHGAHKRFMRFGKRLVGESSSLSSDKRFMRFGKRQRSPPEGRANRITSEKRFMRFGKR